jgi:hypothetical protein
MTSPAVKLLAAAGGGPFTPESLPGLFTWLDASDTATITGSPTITLWADKSGNGNDATPSGAAPTTGTRTINSLNVLDFDGADDKLSFPATTSSSFTIYMVVEADVLPTAGLSKRLMSNYDGSGALAAGEFIVDVLDSSGDKPRIVFNGGSTTMTSTITTGTAYVITARFGNGTGDTTTLIQFNDDGGVASGGTSGSTAAIRDWAVGEDSTVGTAEYWNGKIAEIIVYDGYAHGSADRTLVKDYLYSKWGITP